jgi:NAD(P)-dependent dehydrogenase (short-subunit alcohol dehydrogenase family)
MIHVGCEVIDDASVKHAVAKIENSLEAEGLDILINNIGVSQYVANCVFECTLINS